MQKKVDEEGNGDEVRKNVNCSKVNYQGYYKYLYERSDLNCYIYN